MKIKLLIYLLGLLTFALIYLVSFYKYVEYGVTFSPTGYYQCEAWRNHLTEKVWGSAYGGPCKDVSEYKYYSLCFNKQDTTIKNLFWYVEECR